MTKKKGLELQPGETETPGFPVEASYVFDTDAIIDELQYKPLIRTPYNHRKLPQHYSKGGGVSLTVPDLSMTVPELIQRHTRGLSLGAPRVAFYEGDEDPTGLDGVSIQALDLAEQMERLELAKKQYRQAQKSLYDSQLLARQKAQDLENNPPAPPTPPTDINPPANEPN